jgi:NAD(P)-dependent dehydrogenase (short-subunit alcohol dehydrogenase family)
VSSTEQNTNSAGRRLADRTALVTGAGSGIGAEIAQLAAREGARVAVVDRDREGAGRTVTAIESSGGRAIAVYCDLEHFEADALLDSVEDELGPCSLLFNNAGIAVLGDAVAHSPADYRRVMAINVDAVWFLSREFVLRRRGPGGGGAIVNTASVNAWYVEPAYAAYCASKGAVFAMTRAMAYDHAREGIRINCVCPGWTETGMTTPVFEEQTDPAGARKEAGKTHALGRIGRPSEIAAAAIFLTTDEASFFVGSPLIVDGGMSLGVGVA